ncbi:diguanylate cyclase domain-containing protein [Paenibacillus methanolicus]|uniref:Diguanylate cyclase (GGDEF)-like protein n=1 Tax=Paenibacillus methanolicus TaxID=582686 RepID=A0A5S5CNA3_9BACL|nr:diguanylate cyclase [Paenibacillus methanolicus]TYP79838.1 diguanylate cyclase (GGDEF)-like protein [Paenibacillus methanolicus]
MPLVPFRKPIQVAILAYLCFCVLIMALYPDSVSLKTVILMIPTVMAVFLAAVTTAYKTGYLRKFWMFITLGTASYSLANLIYYAGGWFDLPSAVSYAADILWNVQTIMFFAALMVLLIQEKNHFRGIRFMLDSFIMMTTLVTLSLEFIIVPNIEMMLENMTWLGIATNVVYPISDLGILFCILHALYSYRFVGRHESATVYFLIAGMVLFVVADAFYMYQLAVGTFIAGGWLDLVWDIGLLLIGSSGLYAFEKPVEEADAEEQPKSAMRSEVYNLRRATLPYAGFFFMVGLLVYQHELMNDGIFLGILAAMLLILFRQLSVVNENRLLMSKLQDVLQQTDYMANHDVLTNLPNRRMFKRELDAAVLTCDPLREQVAVLFIDLDRFKAVNDSLGHAAGDQLIFQVSQRLAEAAHGTCSVVSRLSGDEFTILLRRTNADQLRQTACRIVNALSAPFHIGSNEICTTGSVGGALSSPSGTTSEYLLKNADAAMYLAKQLGGNQYQLHE